MFGLSACFPTRRDEFGITFNIVNVMCGLSALAFGLSACFSTRRDEFDISFNIGNVMCGLSACFSTRCDEFVHQFPLGVMNLCISFNIVNVVWFKPLYCLV